MAKKRNLEFCPIVKCKIKETATEVERVMDKGIRENNHSKNGENQGGKKITRIKPALQDNHRRPGNKKYMYQALLIAWGKRKEKSKGGK